MGRPPFAGQELQPSPPQQLEGDARQAVKSRIIHDFVAEAAGARTNHQNYVAALVRLAEELAEKKSKIEQPAPEQKPRPVTKQEVLSMALYNLGMAAEIGEPTWIQIPERGKLFIFTIKFRGNTIKVALPESILESDDPVSLAEAAIKMHGSRIVEPPELDQPDPHTALGIGEPDLEKRNLLYDGVDTDGSNRFVYMTEGCETIFRVPAGLAGDGLADCLEEKVLGWHMTQATEGRPVVIPFKVLEAHAERIAQQVYPEGTPPQVEETATVLDYLMRISPLPVPELVPEECRAAFLELQGLPSCYVVKVTGAQMREFVEALDELDDPMLVRARKAHEIRVREGGAPLADETIVELVREHLETPVPDIPVCDGALDNLKKAYALLSGNQYYESAPTNVLIKNHALFVLTIRTEIQKMISLNYLVIEE